MLHGLKNRIRKITGANTTAELLAALRPEDRDLISRLRAEKLTYLSEGKLALLASTCRALEEAGLPGILIEAGCALGGSSILIATTKSAARPFRVHDVFGMIPPPTAEDPPEVHERYETIVAGKSTGIRGDPYYGYVANLYDEVQTNLANFGIDTDRQAVSLVKGLVQDTMTIAEPVALAHVDVDWYDPVTTCLTRIFPHLVVGGCIILDDYHDWGGCRKAADEFLASIGDQVELDDSAGSMKITRVRDA